MYKLLTILGLILSLSSCYYDSTDELNPTLPDVNTCDTTNVIMNYTNDIAPIMDQSCGAGNANCHQSGNTASGYNLDNYTEVTYTVMDGSLLGTILHENGYNPMPSGGGTLDDCSINKIKSWINHGYPEN